MEALIIIATIIVLLCLLWKVLKPTFDTINVRGKPRKIMWYNTPYGRDWTFIN